MAYRYAGAIVGANEGIGVGAPSVYVGDAVGDAVGVVVGSTVGFGEGFPGRYDGAVVGALVTASEKTLRVTTCCGATELSARYVAALAAALALRVAAKAPLAMLVVRALVYAVYAAAESMNCVAPPVTTYPTVTAKTVSGLETALMTITFEAATLLPIDAATVCWIVKSLLGSLLY